MPQPNLTTVRPPDPHHVDLANAEDDMIYRITHDLSASMRSLVQLSSWIAEDVAGAGLTLPDETDAHIALLQSRGARLQNMMKDLLIYARVGQAGRAFCGDWGALMRHVRGAVPRVGHYHVRERLKGTPQIGCDDLQTLITVLVSNAVKHHDRPFGKITVAATGNGQFCKIDVADDGPGIPMENRIHLCKPLTSLEPRDDFEGSGMGLAIATRIAKFYGGALHIADTAQGEGCHVTVTLPLQIN